MLVELLVTEECPACEKEIAIWQSMCKEMELTLSIMDIHEAKGSEYVKKFRLATIPALLIDGELVAVGVQSHKQALTLVSYAQPGIPPD